MSTNCALACEAEREARRRRPLHNSCFSPDDESQATHLSLLAFGVLSLVRRGNLWDFVEGILDFLHVDLDGRFAQRFLDLADRLSDTRLWVLATYAGAYCALRFVEAYGLWKARVWAEWVALISGAIYLPFEIYELFRRITIVRASVLIVNLAIVLYMLYLRTIARSKQPKPV